MTEQVRRTCPSCGQQVPIESSLIRCPHCLRLFVAGENAIDPPGVITPSFYESPAPAEGPLHTSDYQDQSAGEPADGTPAEASLPPRLGRYRIERLLGQGGFGVVYLAVDEQLNREVAIKLLRSDLARTPRQREIYLAEAQIVAGLDHPNILPVHDVGTAENGLPFVVSPFIRGTTLKARISDRRPSLTSAVEIVATIATACHEAHKKGIVHRDIKPANILIATSDRPYLMDFGIALQEGDFGKGAHYTGTPLYMSPEQASGEGHRVDGRTDVFSLGVVLYELITGRRPFRGETREELLDEIINIEARPPRQIDDSIPRELERICLKALARRAADRYTTALDLADDLRQFLAAMAAQDRTPLLRDEPAEPRVEVPRPLEGTPRLVPKGLRSFDREDAYFYLQLLPGARDRQGLPESLRFWKHRVEPLEATTFSIGLLYGPSGCGKSSLMKAGLLPRLSSAVKVVYLEATADRTENGLETALRRHIPGLPTEAKLGKLLFDIRQGRYLPREQKLLLVLDQFEQWLHGHRGPSARALTQALRQCDGARVQCILLVRDDFWLAVSRFMAGLEVDLVQGQNMAFMDLFDTRHARQVLMAFGQAYGALPGPSEKLSKEQAAFLDQVSSGLDRDGRVNPVRLVTFAEMVKSKPWTLATLKAVGGTSGVETAFLEETFSGPTAPPLHRLYKEAAQRVLHCLLPEAGTNIKGHRRSCKDLMEAAQFADHPDRFANLLTLLDGELRLITPVDPEGVGQEPSSPGDASYYQLTHDDLVLSLRAWLTREQKQTRQGRAELLLTEQTAEWKAKPDTRHLPTWWEWTTLRMLTWPRRWNFAQKEMMTAANRYYSRRLLGVCGLLVLVGVLSVFLVRELVQQRNEIHATGLVRRVLDAETPRVPDIVAEMPEYRRWIDPLLRTHLAGTALDSRQRLHASLALLPVEAGQTEYLVTRLLEARPTELAVLIESLLPYKEMCTEALWATARQSVQGKEAQRLRAACALAVLDPQPTRWKTIQRTVAQDLISRAGGELGGALRYLHPVRAVLIPALVPLYQDPKLRDSQRVQVSELLGEFAADQPGILGNLVVDADERQFPVLLDRLAALGPRATAPLLEQLKKEVVPAWNDAPLKPAWRAPEAELVTAVESAQGMLHERFAFCQAQPLEEFLRLAPRWQATGYRPIRVRPYRIELATGPQVRVAAIWIRDGQVWKFEHGILVEQVAERVQQRRQDKFHPVDLAVELVDDQPRFSILWEQGQPEREVAELVLGLDGKQLQDRAAKLIQAGYWRFSLCTYPRPDGSWLYAALWRKPTSRYSPREGEVGDQVYTGREAGYSGAWVLGEVQVDVQLARDQTCTAIWQPLGNRTARELHGLDPATHRKRCNELIAQGYRPVSVAVGPGETTPLRMASVWHRPVVSEEEYIRLAKRRAQAGITLLRLEQVQPVWPLLEPHPDPLVRSYLIDQVDSKGVEPSWLVQQARQTNKSTIRQNLLLALGQFKPERLPAELRDMFVEELFTWYQRDPDAGIHAAGGWLLKQWGHKRKLQRIDQALAKQSPRFVAGQADQRRWFVNSQRQTLAILPGGEFLMGSPRSEKRREGGANNQIERLHRTRIERIFALGTHEVTVQEFLRFRKDHPYNRTYTPGGDFPMMGVSWYDMAAYCNWLSEREGLPREQWCYHPNAEGKYAPGMYVNPHYLTLQGYRLPTEAEWEYACRAGTQTSSYHGSTSDQLGRYVWFGQGGADRTRAVGQMCPNDWGLFDMLGNVGECTQDGLTAYTVPDTGLSSLDSERLDPVDAGTIRVFRGGSFVDSPLDIRSARRYRTLAGSRGGAVGFRVARTIVPTPHPERQQVIDQLLPLLDQPGDGIKGKMVFQTQCVRCHTHANTGTALGPDLMLLRGWSKQEILVHLIDPSRQMADRYRVYQATTREGRSIQGILTTETPLAVELTDAEGAHHLIQRDDLVQLVITPASLMPEDFEKRLKEQELIDLLAFLTQPGKFVPLPLDRVATAISTKTLFNSGENKIERMIFPDWSPKKIAEVPFVLVDPRDNRVPNIVLLHSPLNAITASRPKSVRLPCPTSARAIHLLSGVSGRGYPVTEKGTLTLTIRLHYADGSTEHHDLINGVHFADYQGRMNVPGSRFALALGGNQIRFLSILPRRHDRIEAIEFLKGTDGTAPMVLAVTLEMP